MDRLTDAPMDAPMDTQGFLAALEPHADKPLVFALAEGRVGPGYHVTEVKAVTVQAMDCGGRNSAWQETVIQLWAPQAAPDGGDLEGFMSVRKFLDIFGRVAAHVSVEGAALLRLEYGAACKPAISYLVTGLEPGPDRVTVRLAAPAVACKPASPGSGDVPSLSALPLAAQRCC